MKLLLAHKNYLQPLASYILKLRYVHFSLILSEFYSCYSHANPIAPKTHHQHYCEGNLINNLLLRHSLDTAKISNKPTKQKPELMTTTSNTKLHEILFTVLS